MKILGSWVGGQRVAMGEGYFEDPVMIIAKPAKTGVTGHPPGMRIISELYGSHTTKLA